MDLQLVEMAEDMDALRRRSRQRAQSHDGRLQGHLDRDYQMMPPLQVPEVGISFSFSGSELDDSTASIGRTRPKKKKRKSFQKRFSKIINICASIIGAITFVIGSVYFYPKYGTRGVRIGSVLFIIGSSCYLFESYMNYVLAREMRQFVTSPANRDKCTSEQLASTKLYVSARNFFVLVP